MKILGLIPARGGSKGVPRKNIKRLGDQELVIYSIALGLACPQLDAIVVSTDDQEIAEISKSAGAMVPFLRPDELATDDSPTIDTVIHALEFLAKQGNNFDAVCLLQPTVPFRATEDIVGAINKFKALQPDSLISVRPVPHIYNPHWIYEAKGDTDYLEKAIKESSLIRRRQELPKAFHRDGAIYITKTETLLKKNSLYGDKIVAYQMQYSPNINIDTVEDWNAAESYLAKSKLNESR